MLHNSYCYVSHSLANVINATKTITFVNTFGSVSVFVFVVKEDFDLPCLPQDYKDEIGISELVEFCNTCLTEFFVFTAKRSLMKTFFRSSKRKFGMLLSSCDESFRKFVDCMRNKTFWITCIDERSF